MQYNINMQYNMHALHLWQILQTKYMYVLLIKQITVNICNNKKHIISCKTIQTNYYNILLLINIYIITVSFHAKKNKKLIIIYKYI